MLKRHPLLDVIAKLSASTIIPCALVALTDSANIRGIELFAICSFHETTVFISFLPKGKSLFRKTHSGTGEHTL